MTFKSKARRAGWLLVVAAFAFGIVAAVKPAHTQAYSLISNRFVQMSSSEASTVGGGGTVGINVIYNVGFTVASPANVGSIVIRFCANNPIIGDTCTAPADFSTNKATLSNSFTGSTAGLDSGWTMQTATGGANELLFTRSSTAAVVAGNSISLVLGNGTTNGIRNPSSTNTTFFARIMMFQSTVGTMPNVLDDENVPPTGASNAGGVAMSTANVLNVTAKVQEALTFCVYTGANCAAGGNAVNLGTAENVLAATNTYYTDASPKFDLASNALAGVAVRMKGDTLTSGLFTITPQLSGTNGCTADLTTTSSEQFGMRVVSYGAGQEAHTVGKYDCLAGNHMFEVTQANTTYGQGIVKTNGATDVSTTNLELGAKAANTTEAGVYTTKLQLIATATY